MGSLILAVALVCPGQYTVTRANEYRVAPAPIRAGDYDAAYQFCVKNNCPMVLWVGLTCPSCEKTLPGARHAHTPDFLGNKGPAVVVAHPDGAGGLTQTITLNLTGPPDSGVIRRALLKDFSAAAPPPIPRDGTHSHRCTHCGATWTHSDSSFGNRAAHMCPQCGAGPHWSPFRAQPARQFYSLPAGFGGVCPPGRG